MAAYVQKLLGDPDYADGQDTGYCNPQPDDIIVFAGKGHAGMCPGDGRNGPGDNVLRPRRPISPGDIPVEALIQWSWAANKHSAVSSPKTELYSGNYMYYALASSKEVKNCRTRRNLLLRRTVSPAWIPMIWETTSFTSR